MQTHGGPAIVVPDSTWTSLGVEFPAQGGDRHRSLVAGLEHNRISIQAGSRLHRFTELLASFRRGDIHAESSDTELMPLLSAYRDIGELDCAVSELLPTDDPTLLAKIRDALSGAATALEDSNPLARNTQFELFVGGLLKKAGYDPVFREPDILFTLDGTQVGVAAKRLTSGKKFFKRLREGGNQLKRAGLWGLVAMNLDALADAPNVMGRANELDSLVKKAGKIVTSPLEKLGARALDETTGLPVLGLFGSISVPFVIPNERRVGNVMSMLVRGFLDRTTPAQQLALKHLSERMAEHPPL